MIGGLSLARRGVDMLRAGGAGPVIVVTGAAGAGDLGTGPVPGAPVVSTSPVPGRGDIRTVHNPDWAEGMGSSLRAGLAAVPAGCAAAVLALADQPLVGPEAVRRLIRAYAGGAAVAVATYAGQPRNPVLISRVYWPQVCELAVGDVGARPFLRAHPELVTPIACDDTGQPDDVDTPADLDRVRALITGDSGADG